MATNWMDDFYIPGERYRVSGLLMMDEQATRTTLEMVADFCGGRQTKRGLDAAASVAAEMQRRRRQKRIAISQFFVNYERTNNIDEAIQAAIDAPA